MAVLRREPPPVTGALNASAYEKAVSRFFSEMIQDRGYGKGKGACSS